MTGKERRTVYFKVPKYWDNAKEIRAFLYDSDEYNFYTTSFSVKESQCERVKEKSLEIYIFFKVVTWKQAL